MPVKDIGGGNVMVDLSKGPSLLDTAKDQLGLVDLAQRVRMGPIEQKIKEVDLALKGNDLLMADIENETKRAQLIKARNDEVRAQSESFLKNMESLPALINQSPELANQFLSRFGGALAKNDKGGYTVDIQTPNGIKSFQGFEPGKVVDPKARTAAVEGWRKEYAQSAKDYQTVFENFKGMEQLSTLGTGAADIGIIYAYNKILDPGSRVAQGEVLTAENAPGLSVQLRNKYNRALTDQGPIFGPVGSSARRAFVDSAKTIYETKRSNTARNAEFFAKTAAGALGVDTSSPEVRAVVQPFGDVTYESVFGVAPEQALTDGSAPPANQPVSVPGGKAPNRPAPVGAGVLPGQAQETQAPKSQFKTTDELLRNNLFKGLVPRGGRR